MAWAEWRRFIGHIIWSILRYALIGALILGAVGAALQLVFWLLGQMPEVDLPFFLRTTANWALIGGLFAGILGLIYGLLTSRNW
jgi:hypothetical protein